MNRKNDRKKTRKWFFFLFRTIYDDEKSMSSFGGAHLHSISYGGEKAHYCCCFLMYIRQHKILRACKGGAQRRKVCEKC